MLNRYEITDGLGAEDYIAFPAEDLQEGAPVVKNDTTGDDTDPGIDNGFDNGVIDGGFDNGFVSDPVVGG